MFLLFKYLGAGAIAICTMTNFETLPPKIEGKVVVSLKNYVTIAVTSKDEKETVEMTFPRNKCKIKE